DRVLRRAGGRWPTAALGGHASTPLLSSLRAGVVVAVRRVRGGGRVRRLRTRGPPGRQPAAAGARTPARSQSCDERVTRGGGISRASLRRIGGDVADDCSRQAGRAPAEGGKGMRRILVALAIVAVLAVGLAAPSASAQDYGYDNGTPGFGMGYGYNP